MFDHTESTARSTPKLIVLGLVAFWAGACERADVANSPPLPTAAITPEPEARRPRSSKLALPVSFPQELRVDDESVNAFVERALVGVAAGEYEPYRLLWSMKDEPLSRSDYERRWHGVTDIQLRALRRIILTTGKPSLLGGDGQPAGDASYALLADFSFSQPGRVGLLTGKARLRVDPPAQREPLRGVVWIIAKERDKWRLAKPPKAVKRWLRDQVAASTPQRTDSDPDLP